MSEPGRARSYRQYCALARALDVIGERWTLLIVRELLLGTRRFSDLLKGLPGISRNLLSARLHELEEHGIAERGFLAAPARGPGWQLTRAGRELEPAVLAIGRWGARYMTEPPGDDAFDPGWLVVSLRASHRPEAAHARPYTYELRLDGRPFTIRLTDDGVTTAAGSAGLPDAVITASAQSFVEILSRTLPPHEALTRRRIRIDGPPAALDQFTDLFAWQLDADP